MTTSLAEVSALDLLAGYRAGAFTPIDCWNAVEERIAAVEPSIAALYAYRPERARREAAASAARWRRHAPIGPLDGIPVTVKELIATEGDPIPLGTAATQLAPLSRDAPPSARLREAGAIIFAKTTCPDYGMLSSGLSSFHPLTRNPWDVAMNPGGSSSGSGAAGAAGYGPLHLGTDIGGSIRLPAAWTGLFGLKPSYGRVPIDPTYVGRCAGPMTRTVADAALMMATISRPDARDGTGLPPDAIDWLDLDLDVRGLRLGLMLDAGCGLPVDPEILAAIKAVAARFEAAGAIVTEVGPVLSRAMLDGLDHYWRARFWGEISQLPAERRDRILPYIRQWVASAETMTGAEAIRGFDQTFAIRAACARLFQGFDAVLSPVAPVVRFAAEWASPLNDPDRPFEHIAFTVPWNMSEQPAAAIHCGFSASGMPIGLQIVGPRFGDAFVLKLAAAYERWRGPITTWPQPAGMASA